MANRETLTREWARILRFTAVGLVNTAIYTVLYIAFVAISLPYLAAAILAFAISVAIAYFLNHRFTFRVADHSTQLVVQFFTVQGFGALVNIAALTIAVEWLGWTPIGAQLVIIPPVVAMTFVANRLIVFRAQVDTRGA
jgi:putative flippase GtrA